MTIVRIMPTVPLQKLKVFCVNSRVPGILVDMAKVS